MKATEKSPAIETLLTQLTGRNRMHSIENSICNLCGEGATKFFDQISRKEYFISGMCQKCQDEAFTS